MFKVIAKITLDGDKSGQKGSSSTRKTPPRDEIRRTPTRDSTSVRISPPKESMLSATLKNENSIHTEVIDKLNNKKKGMSENSKRILTTSMMFCVFWMYTVFGAFVFQSNLFF